MAWRFIRALDLVDQLGQVRSPVLVVVGEFDPVTPVAAAEEVVAALPAGRARLEVVPGAGHFTWLDAPDLVWGGVPPLIREVTEVVHVRARVTARRRGLPRIEG